MFKIISKAVMTAGIVVLAGCGSLPEKSKVEANTGILAIAKAYKSEVNFGGGWAPEVAIRKVGSSDIERTVIMPPVNGKQFQIVKNLAPGSYVIDKVRSVPIDATTAIGSKGPWRPMFTTFKIQVDEVTVLDKLLLVETISVGGGNRATTRRKFADWTPERKSTYVKLMEKYNKKGQWKVVDKKGQPFTN